VIQQFNAIVFRDIICVINDNNNNDNNINRYNVVSFYRFEFVQEASCCSATEMQTDAAISVTTSLQIFSGHFPEPLALAE
jgi:hypothetical protein